MKKCFKSSSKECNHQNRMSKASKNTESLEWDLKKGGSSTNFRNVRDPLKTLNSFFEKYLKNPQMC